MNPIYEISLDDAPWQFDYFGIFFEGGEYYYEFDSGCSCPTPWDRFSKVSDLVGPISKNDLIQVIRKLEMGLPALTVATTKQHAVDFLKSHSG